MKRRGTSKPSKRPEQVGETIRQVIADAITRGELRDPRVGFVTVTRVDASRDLSHATVLVSVMGSEEEKQRSLEGLANAAGFFRTRITRALSSRTVPELHFTLDRGLEHAARINQLLADIRPEDGN